MTTLYCAICEEGFEPDVDHVHVKAEKRLMRDRNRIEDYYLCMDCALDELDDWIHGY